MGLWVAVAARVAAAWYLCVCAEGDSPQLLEACLHILPHVFVEILCYLIDYTPALLQVRQETGVLKGSASVCLCKRVRVFACSNGGRARGEERERATT